MFYLRNPHYHVTFDKLPNEVDNSLGNKEAGENFMDCI